MAQFHVFSTAPREIVITNHALENGNIEAWINIIHSYQLRHPEHEVVIRYQGMVVQDMLRLYKEQNLQREGFQLAVKAEDGDLKDVPKLYRLLVEGASPRFAPFINKNVYQVLELF